MALLLVLGVLVIAATVATGVSRRALQESAEARDAIDRLQARWLSISAERAILPRAEALLGAEESRQRQPVPMLLVRLELNGKTQTLELSDDTARVNPIRLSERSGEIGWARTVRETLPPALRSHFDADRVNGFLFDNPRRAMYADIFRPDAGMVENFDALLTPHGRGEINLLRAGEDALRLALVPPLTKVEVRDLLRARRDAFEQIDDIGRERALLQLLREAGVSINVGDDVQLWTAESTRHRLKTTVSDTLRTTTRVRVIDTSETQPLDVTRVYSAGELP